MAQLDVAFDEVQGELSRRHACDERMDVWMRREAETLGRLRASGAVASGGLSRLATLQLVLDVLRALRVPANAVPRADIFEVAQLIDLSARRMGMGRSPGEDMARGLACWTVSLKLSTCDASTLRAQHRRLLVEMASVWSAQLGGEAICWQDVERCEVELLTECCDCVSMPTVATWLEAFVTRIDVCARGAFAAKLNGAIALGRTWAFMLVLHLRIDERHGPRALAQGLAAALAVAMGAVRAEDLFAQHGAVLELLAQVLEQSGVRPARSTPPVEKATAALEYALGLDLRAAARLAEEVLVALAQQLRPFPEA